MPKVGLLAESAFLQLEPDQVLAFPILVVGGSTAAFAAAVGALQAGAQVCLVQPQAIWGGQLTTQALPAYDDGQLLAPKVLIPANQRDPKQLDNADAFALSRTQRQLRDRQRQLQPVAGQVIHNPGGGWVTHCAINPVTAAVALNEWMMPYLESGQLTLIPWAEPIQVLFEQSPGNRRRVVGVVFQDTQTQHLFTIQGQIVVEATDLGDLLELGNIESRVGQESRAQTGEAILPQEARPECQQAFTFCAVVERAAAGQGIPIGAPSNYDQVDWLRSTDFTSTFWIKTSTGTWRREGFYNAYGIFRYRRLHRSHGDHRIRIGDVTVLNWGTSPLGVEGGPPQTADGSPLGCGNDYRFGRLVGVSRSERQIHLQRGRDRAQAYVHFLQTHESISLNPRRDLTWTPDGIALEPYIREARRGIALTTIRHEDVAQKFFPGQVRARSFEDSVGIGQYHYMDMHPNDAPGHVDLKDGHAALPFTIPLGALVPIQTDGLILSAKSLGTTHITNSAYRMHGTEWAIGEAGGHLAALALAQGIEVREVVQTPRFKRQLQGQLTRAGIPIFWFNDLSHDDPDFEAIQVLAAIGIVRTESLKHLNFNPHHSITRAVVAIAVVNVMGFELLTPATPTFTDVPGDHFAYASIETLVARGIVVGVGNQQFAPQRPITREQLSFILAKAVPFPVGPAFVDTPRDRQLLQRRELSRVLYWVLLRRVAAV